ncbi:hypothetical protein LCGC14_1404430 [marine sediment metagenome]|uniref:Uncharacterized protein n=1 Tax=marine sediment metagenome TaxID=412755 RepID=A0A0F9MBI5_9ZZZZ
MKKQINGWWEAITLSLLGIATFVGAWDNHLILTATGIIGIIWILHLNLSNEIDELKRRKK